MWVYKPNTNKPGNKIFTTCQNLLTAVNICQKHSKCLSTAVKNPKIVISHFLSLNVRYKPNTQDLQNIKLAKFQNRRLCINAYACLITSPSADMVRLYVNVQFQVTPLSTGTSSSRSQKLF